jgi:hypothetical protein
MFTSKSYSLTGYCQNARPFVTGHELQSRFRPRSAGAPQQLPHPDHLLPAALRIKPEQILDVFVEQPT